MHAFYSSSFYVFLIFDTYITVIMNDSKLLCGKCNVNIPKNLRVIKCNSCNKYFHVKCCNVNHNSYNKLIQNNMFWDCNDCKSTHFNKNFDVSKKCRKCKRHFDCKSKIICCNVCNHSFHFKCVDFNISLTHRMSSEAIGCCHKCISESLPFHSLDSEGTRLAIHGPRGVDMDLIDKPSFTIKSLLDQMPGQHFSSDEFLNDSISSKYYSASDFLVTKLSNNFTMLHLNIASLNKHIDELRNLLTLLNFPFDVIGISETRLYDDNPLVNIGIEGYDFIHTPTSTKCGGAGFYIKSSYDYEINKEFTKSISNLTESMFIEIKRKKEKDLLIGCIYRHITAKF